jgi:hypothetical protein
MKNTKFFLLLIALLAASGCADNITLQEAIVRQPVGFWYGLWHGFCAPYAMIGHLFDNSIAVWAVYNSGGWYWFGFLGGIGCLFGAGQQCRKQNRD